MWDIFFLQFCTNKKEEIPKFGTVNNIDRLKTMLKILSILDRFFMYLIIH